MTRKFIFNLIIILSLGLLSGCDFYSRFGTNSFSGIYLFPDQLSAINLGMSEADITKLIGTPSVVNTFDQKTWYYIYQKSNTFAVFREKLLEQNVLILTFNDQGILQTKSFKNLKDSHLIEYDDNETHMNYKKSVLTKDSF